MTNTSYQIRKQQRNKATRAAIVEASAKADRRLRPEVMTTELDRIAKLVLGLETLETRNSDGLDFSDLAVWTLKHALEEAYKAGQRAR